MQRSYSTKLGAVGLLKRSLSYVSLSVSHQETNQFENRKGLKLFTSFSKGKSYDSYVRPRRYSCPKGETIKDGFVWTQIIPHVKKDWQLRYLVLFNEKLCYLKEPVCRNSKEMEWREIGVKGIVSVKIPNETLVHAVTDTDESNMLYLKVNAKTSPNKILFRFKSQQERDEWITAFLTAKSRSLLDDRISEADENEDE